MTLLTRFNERVHIVRSTEERYIPTGRWYDEVVGKVNSFFNLFADTNEELLETVEGIETNTTLPDPDSTDNDTTADVVGNKEDTSARITHSPSLMNFAKGGYYHIHAPAKIYPSLSGPVQLTADTTEWTLGTKVPIIGAIEETLDAAAAVDNADGTVTLPITAHGFIPGDYVRIEGTTNYDGVFLVEATAANTITITATFVAETFAGTEDVRDCIGKAFDVHFVKISNISDNGYYELVLWSGEDTEEVEIGRVGFWRGSPQVRQDDNPIQIPVLPKGTRITASLAFGPAGVATCDVKLYYHEYPDSY